MASSSNVTWRTMDSIRSYLLLILSLLFLNIPAACYAHPVTQGRMEVEVAKDTISVTLWIASEQVLVEHTFYVTEAKEDPYIGHGNYISKHLSLTVDSVKLQPRIVSVPTTESARAGAAEELIPFKLAYRLPDQGHIGESAKLNLSQDFLREIEFAPGNRWEATFVVNVEKNGGRIAEGRLLTYSSPLEIDLGETTDGSADASRPLISVMREYLEHGIHHIITGYDHLLFVSALVLATVTFTELILIVSTFTLAHTLTLLLSFFNIVRLPSGIVEPMIAASIVFVSFQNIFFPRAARGWSRFTIAFFFGLFHGLGFAQGLLEAMSTLPTSLALWALASFSVGVEIGHQLVVIPLAVILRAFTLPVREMARKERIREVVARVGSAAICLAGVYYFMQSVS